MAKIKKSRVIVEILISDEPSHQALISAELRKLKQAILDGKNVKYKDASDSSLWLVLE